MLNRPFSDRSRSSSDRREASHDPADGRGGAEERRAAQAGDGGQPTGQLSQSDSSFSVS